MIKKDQRMKKKKTNINIIKWQNKWKNRKMHKSLKEHEQI